MALTSARGLALAALRRWRTTRDFADAVIGKVLRGDALPPADRAFTQELFYGVLRHLTLLDFFVDQLREGDLDDETRDILRLGMYQLIILGTPGHAAVFETTSLAPTRSRGLVNAVLRNAIRRRPQLEKATAAIPLHIRTSHPEFLLERWRSRFGDEPAAELCRWDNQPPPLYARINTLRIGRDDFLKKYPALAASENHPVFVHALALPLEALAQGDCYIQDPSTALAVDSLAPQRGDNILDACAAPGGKTSYLAALVQNQARLIACDHAPERVALLQENLARLAVSANVVQHDWTSEPAPAELHGVLFDRILLDAPCSNTGVLRRRVDARWRLRPDEFTRMASRQLALAQSVLPLLKPGGVFVYSTCSLEMEENEDVVAQIMAAFPQLRLTTTKSTLPFRDHVDGAYVARFVSM
ncbi:MAG: transcription antitermination factor NusB [Verrucomicrobiota bacterium]